MLPATLVKSEILYDVCYDSPMSEIDFMAEALKQAKFAQTNGDLPFGAVIVCNNEIVGYGKCEDGTTGDVTSHAEMNALRMACKNLNRNKLNDCTVFATNEPCPMCAAALFQAKIPRVVMALRRQELGNLLRSRKIGIKELAEDSGYQIALEKGEFSTEVFELFAQITKDKA